MRIWRRPRKRAYIKTLLTVRSPTSTFRKFEWASQPVRGYPSLAGSRSYPKWSIDLLGMRKFSEDFGLRDQSPKKLRVPAKHRRRLLYYALMSASELHVISILLKTKVDVSKSVAGVYEEARRVKSMMSGFIELPPHS